EGGRDVRRRRMRRDHDIGLETQDHPPKRPSAEHRETPTRDRSPHPQAREEQVLEPIRPTQPSHLHLVEVPTEPGDHPTESAPQGVPHDDLHPRLLPQLLGERGRRRGVAVSLLAVEHQHPHPPSRSTHVARTHFTELSGTITQRALYARRT